MSTPIETVQAIYTAFGQGDIAAILSHLSEDIIWEQWEDHSGQKAGVSWMAQRNGPAEVAGFFEIIGGFTFHVFDIVAMMAGGDKVAVEVRVDVTIDGVRRCDEEIHLWTVGADGKATRFRHYIDTAKHLAVSA